MSEIKVTLARGRLPAYSRGQIAVAAVAIADREGIDAVSMRRVAAQIGTKATSLYRYVRSKDELLALMVEQVMADAGVPEAAGDWRERLREIAYHTRAVLKRHPWLIMLSIRFSFGPSSLALTEATLRVLDHHQLDADGMLLIANVLATFTRGHAAQEFAEQLAEARSELDQDEWISGQGDVGEAIRADGRFPLFTRIIDDAKAPHDPDRSERSFAEGLEYLLDGIGLRLEGRGA